MKTKNLLSIVIGLIVAITVLSVNHSAFTRSSSAPPPEYTGAPGESTCTSCHNDFDLNSGDGSLSIIVGADTATEYKADSTYTVTVEVKDASQAAYGFEITALNSNDNKAGSFTASSSNTAIQTQNSREYVSHNSGVSSNNTWTFEWTAPSSDVGNITFYMAGNAADDDGSNDGDLIYTGTRTLSPSVATSVFSQKTQETSSFKVYPTQAANNETINISFTTQKEGTCQVHIYDTKGNQYATILDKTLPAGKHEKEVDPSSFDHGKGVHFVTLVTPEGKETRTVVF